MTKEEMTICKIYLEDIDKTHDCNEYKLLMALLEQQPSENWHDIPSEEMTLEQARQAVKDLRKKLVEQQPSEDCVSRAEVLKFVEYFNNPTFIEPMGTLRNMLKDLPTVTPTQKWIPVSERLPEDRNIVLVTAYWHETYQVMMASYFGEGLWWCVPFNNCGDHMQKLNPKAWLPLPKPYEDKRGNENGSN